MILRTQQSRPRFFFSSLVFLPIFILSGCSDSPSTPDPEKSNNQQPTAKIIASLVSTAGETVTLDGSSSSDPDGDTLNFRWEQMEGPNVTLSDVSTATLSFVAPTVLQSTQFTFQLTVDDGDLSSTASVSFQLSPSDTNSDQPNQQPYAMITAPEAATSGQTVTLNGSGSSDPDGDNLSYQWTQTEGASITFSTSTSSSLTFVAPTVSQTTQFTFQLTVADGALSSSASVSIQVTPLTTTNQQPIAKIITETETATSGQTVTLNGSGSSDPDGGTLSYQWTQTQGPDIVLSNSSSSNLIFVAPAVTQTTQFTFQLTVHDGELSNSASVSMQISPMGGNTSPTCATAEGNNSLTLSCPSGEVITEVVFASYGTPVGSCGSFTKGSCNASNSVTVVSDACKEKNSCTLYAGNDTFDDPCEGETKKLVAEVACGMAASAPDKDWTNADPREVVRSGNPGNVKLENYANQEIGNPTIGLEGTGTAREITGPIVVPPGVVYDGKGETLTAKGMGDGSQNEEQQPYFILLPGAGLKNVTLTAPGVEGVHMMGDNRLDNIVWKDVGEDAASIRSYFPGGTIRITGGSVNSASDKVFQLNAPSKIIIKDFKATDISKLVRQNEAIPIEVVLDNVTATSVKTALVMCNTSDCTLMHRDVSGSPLTKGPVRVIDWVEGASD